MTVYTVALNADAPVEIRVDDYGSGAPFLLLHGGAGPQSVVGFAQQLAADGQAHVYVPTHPGFGGTLRPDELTTIGELAQLYIRLIEQLDLRDVTVVGSSIGGWIAAEIDVLNNPRIQRVILLDATGIVVEGQTVMDIFGLSLDELAQYSYFNPAAFRLDLSTFSEAQKQIMATNRQSLAVYGGQSMTDPTLRQRLSAVTTPTLVLWGDHDGIVTPEYGRAYAAAIPNARFLLLPNSGHMPQLETPDLVLSALWDFVKAPVPRT